jgi:hypothetical protein
LVKVGTKFLSLYSSKARVSPDWVNRVNWELVGLETAFEEKRLELGSVGRRVYAHDDDLYANDRQE